MGIRETLSDVDPELLFLTEQEYDEAIMGLTETFEADGPHMRVLYNRAKVIEVLARHMGAGKYDATDEAEEFFEFNIAGAYVGPHTPAFFTQAEL